MLAQLQTERNGMSIVDVGGILFNVRNVTTVSRVVPDGSGKGFSLHVGIVAGESLIELSFTSKEEAESARTDFEIAMKKS
jgi:hypothetical protein